MLENYINQIITMGALADSVTIIDDRQIIRYFQPFNPNIVPFQASDVVGTHFRSAFLDVDPDESGVLKALHGEATLSETPSNMHVYLPKASRSPQRNCLTTSSE